MAAVTNVTSVGLAGMFASAFQLLIRDNPLLGEWMRGVPQDSENERIKDLDSKEEDVVAEWSSLRQFIKSELLQHPQGQTARRSAMSFVNSWFLDERKFNVETDATLAYELLYRLEKFAYVMSIAESENLRSFDGNPTPRFADIPTSLAHLAAWLCDARRAWAQIVIARFPKHREACVRGRSILRHYAAVPAVEAASSTEVADAVFDAVFDASLVASAKDSTA